MLLRTLLTFVNLGAISAAILVLLAYPKYDGPAFYILVGWMFGSMVLVYGPWGNRTVGSARATPPSTPLASSPGFGPRPSSAPAEIPFCIYCAAPLAPGATLCPACGHRATHV